MHALEASTRVTSLNYRVYWQSPEGGLLYQVSGGGLMILNADGTGYGMCVACLLPALRKRVRRARSQISLSLSTSISLARSLARSLSPSALVPARTPKTGRLHVLV